MELKPISPLLKTYPELQGQHILLVDDDELNLNVGKTMLEYFGLTALTADSAEQAFQVLDNTLPTLIFMDLRMPDMTGYDALKKLRQHEQWHSIPIIALTANNNETEKNKAMKAGMDDFIRKPLTPQTLEKTLLKWVIHNTENSILSNEILDIHPEKRDSQSVSQVKEKLKNLVALLGRNPSIQLFRTVDDTIYAEFPQLLTLLKKSQILEASALAHRLKGAFSLYSSQQLEALLQKISEKDVDLNDIENLCLDLSAEFSVIKTELKPYIEST